jgi:UDP-3-O-[3-hydroxymyristoyl] glucosamine N-acyltransferase
MALTLEALARTLGGRLDGPAPGPTITGIAPITEAGPDQITFLTEVKQVGKHLEELRHSRAAAVIAAEKAGPLPLPAIRFPSAYQGLLAALAYFHPEPPWRPGIHPTAFVDEDATVDPTAMVGPLAVVEAGAVIGPRARIDAQVFVGRGARVGAGAHLYPQVVLREGCRVGDDSIIHSGAVIGSDGFGFHTTAAGHAKIPQVGVVEIGARVEIGANVTIDRAAMGCTRVGDGTKIDNLVHLAHNVQVGKDCLIVAQVGLSGSTILEDRVTLAGQVGTVGHVRVGRGTTVAARGVVTEDVPPGQVVSGFPLKPHAEEKRIMLAQRRLPELVRTVHRLEAELARLTEELARLTKDGS